MMSKGRAEKAGIAVANSIVELFHMMYNKKTALRALNALIKSLGEKRKDFNNNDIRDTVESIEEKRVFVTGQARQVFQSGGDNVKVTIRNGKTIPLWAAYRCLYCGEYFNQTGAEEHFGQTRQDYYK